MTQNVRNRHGSNGPRFNDAMMRAVAALFAILLALWPAPGAAQSERVGHVAVEGGALEYVESGSRDGEAVLFLHGSGLADSFALVASDPSLKGYRLIRLHRRGYAGSTEVVGETFSMAQQAADAVALLDALGIEKAHIAGHSYGAAIAVQLAMDAPERIASLILVDIPPPGVDIGLPAPKRDPLALFQAGDRAGAADAFFSMVLRDWRGDFGTVAGGVEQTIADIDTVLLIEGPAMQVFRPDISAITMPLLSIWGSESRLYATDSLTRLKGAIPWAEAQVIEGTDHGLIAQEPGKVAAAIAAFLSRHRL